MMIRKGMIILMSLFILCGCSVVSGSSPSDPVSRTEYVLGTVVTIKLLENGSEELLDLAFARLEEIESLMSVTIETSDIARLNRTKSHQVSDDTMNVLVAGLQYGEISEGRFDITLGPITDLWGIGSEEAMVPSEAQIHDLLKYVDYRAVSIEENNHVVLPEGARIDLGGIAKGYAADEIGDLMVENGVTKAIINLGGNIKVLGTKSESQPFNIGIQSPDDMRNDYLGIVEVSEQTVVTSGDYERYFVEDGKKYHHIFDASTGYPYETDVAAVTVISDRSMMADAFSTILFLMPIEEGLNLCRQYSNLDCIYMTKDKQLYFSSNEIKDSFTLTDLSYDVH